MSQADVITIKGCPKCQRTHRYALQVVRSYALTLARAGTRPATTHKEFTRLFTCLKTGENFQVKFSLEESASDRIDSVAIGQSLPEVPDDQSQINCDGQ